MSEQKEVPPLPILFFVIKIILYIIGFIIFVITFLSIINYIFYVYYYIKETIITNEYLYDVYSLKLTDINNYKLINYIKEFNNKYNKYYGESINVDNCKCYDIKNLKIHTLEKIDTIPKYVLDFDFTTMFNKNQDFREKISKVESNIEKNSSGSSDSAISSTISSAILSMSTIPSISSAIPSISAVKKQLEVDEINKHWPPRDAGIISRIDFNKFSEEDINLLHKFGVKNDENEKSGDIVYGIYKYKDNEFYFKINVKEASSQECRVTKNELQAINRSLYKDIISNIKDIKEENGANKKEIKVVGANGIFGISYLSGNENKSVLKDTFGDVFGYVLNRLYLLFPNNLYYSYDKSSNLYILANNKLYELIFALIFIIFLIVAISVTIDIAKIVISVFIDTKLYDPADAKSPNYTDKFYASIKSTEEKDYKSTTLKLITNPDYYYLIVIPLIITLYCIIHGIMYYYFFIKGAYIHIIQSYDEMTEPDELIRNEIIGCFNKNIIIKEETKK
jgi:hypothetical protein